MKKGKKTWIAALLCMLSMTLICGLLYPLVMTVSASLLFPEQANGSQLTVTRNGKTQNVGSALIGQSWTKPEYLIACIGRKGRIIIPGGDDRIQVGDSVVIVTTERGTEDLREMFRR